ncbi:MAG: transporter [Candidatus Omnitrophica bacterium]|nr:transporter [Candidatus Omnitrophota bacterium]
MKKVLGVIAAGVFLSGFCFVNLVFAARPLSTDDTGTVEKGHFELEFGGGYFKEVARAEETKEVFRATFIDLTLTVGLLENWDIGLSIPYIFIDNPEEKNIDGFEDIEISTKYRLLEEKKILPSYALGVAVKTQSANEDKGLGSGQVEVAVNNIFSQAIGKFAFHLNLGYNFLTKRKGQDNTFFYGLALEYPLIEEKLNLVSEISGETNFSGNFDENITSGLVGFNYALTDWLVFDMGGRFGISKAAAEYEITSGFTLTF